MTTYRITLGPTDVDGLGYDIDNPKKVEQKYCEKCDLAPKTKKDNCYKCGRKLEVIKRKIS